MRLLGLSRSQHGFTFVELVVGIVVAGILAALILPRFGGDTGFNERQFRDETVAALRFAQKTAIAARRTVCATFTASQVSFARSEVFGTADCSGGVPLLGPGSGVLVVAGSNGESYAVQPGTLIFDAAGRPIQGAGTITVSGLPSLPITIQAETGYVH